jgi:hypothetical protein
MSKSRSRLTPDARAEAWLAFVLASEEQTDSRDIADRRAGLIRVRVWDLVLDSSARLKAVVAVDLFLPCHAAVSDYPPLPA